MITMGELDFCARMGMTQAECARHLGRSRAGVSKASRKFGVTFSRIGAFRSHGREMEMAYFCYPWDAMDPGDWVPVTSSAYALAQKASVYHFPKRFVGIERAGQAFVRRAA